MVLIQKKTIKHRATAQSTFRPAWAKQKTKQGCQCGQCALKGKLALPKPVILSSIPRIYRWKERTRPTSCPLTSTHPMTLHSPPTYTHIQLINVKNNKNKQRKQLLLPHSAQGSRALLRWSPIRRAVFLKAKDRVILHKLFLYTFPPNT